MRLGRRAGQLHAAGLAASAHQDLGLDHDLAVPTGQQTVGPAACLGGRSGDLPRRDRQALGEEQRLRVGFLDLHAQQLPAWSIDG